MGQKLQCFLNKIFGKKNSFQWFFFYIVSTKLTFSCCKIGKCSHVLICSYLGTEKLCNKYIVSGEKVQWSKNFNVKCFLMGRIFMHFWTQIQREGACWKKKFPSGKNVAIKGPSKRAPSLSSSQIPLLTMHLGNFLFCSRPSINVFILPLRNLSTFLMPIGNFPGWKKLVSHT